MTITDVELLEISVVSVPCNQDSSFQFVNLLIAMMSLMSSKNL